MNGSVVRVNPQTRPLFQKRLAGMCIALLAMLIASSAWAQVTVVLHRPPPNRLRVADLWVVDLINPTKSPIKVYLHGTADEVSIPSRILHVVDAQSAPFILQPGFHRVTGTDISPIKVNTSDPAYRNIVTTTGVVPSGEYQICVEAKDAATDARLGIDCYDQSIDNSTPPRLITPFDGSEVSEKYPIFTWIAPAPVFNFRVDYSLKIVEIMGQQSPYDAMQSNYSIFAASHISRTLFQYPVASRPLERGKHYAWKIDAYSANAGRSFLVGESEIWDFTYQPLATDPFADGGALTGADVGADVGSQSDSISRHDYWDAFTNGNFYIPYNSVNLFPADISVDPTNLGSMDLYNDPNARNYISNAPNDTSHGGDCLRGPSVHLAFDYPQPERSPSNWAQAFGIDWAVVHNAPLDHIDLRIAIWGPQVVRSPLRRHSILVPSFSIRPQAGSSV
jgi:hypothetical protein